MATVDKGVAVRRLVDERGAPGRPLRRRRPHRPRRLRRPARAHAPRARSTQAVCVGVASDEGPAEIQREADLVVDGPRRVRRPAAALSDAVLRPAARLGRCWSPASPPRSARSPSSSPTEDVDEFALAVAGAWWLVGAADRDLARTPGAGGGGDRAAARRSAHRDQPARARARAGSRSCGCGRSAPSRLLVGGAGWFWPQVAAIGAGYAIRSRSPGAVASAPSRRSRSATASASTSSPRRPSSP